MYVIPPGKMPADFKIETSEIDPAKLDRISDFLLQLGYRRQAERLSRRAAEMREARP
jgi:hypothetical protein